MAYLDFVALACAALGIDRKRLPLTGTRVAYVHNITVCVLPVGMPRRSTASKPHRLVALCPRCDQTMSAGRIQQHAKLVHACDIVDLYPRKKVSRIMTILRERRTQLELGS
jgi:hypothetical protein